MREREIRRLLLGLTKVRHAVGQSAGNQQNVQEDEEGRQGHILNVHQKIVLPERKGVQQQQQSNIIQESNSSCGEGERVGRKKKDYRQLARTSVNLDLMKRGKIRQEGDKYNKTKGSHEKGIRGKEKVKVNDLSISPSYESSVMLHEMLPLPSFFLPHRPRVPSSSWRSWWSMPLCCKTHLLLSFFLLEAQLYYLLR